MPREAVLAGFAPGGPWDTRPPGPELAAALATAAGPQWRCRGASGDQIIGILGRFAAVESWAAAGKLGVIRSLIRDDDPALLCGSRHGDLPDVWDDSLASEIALALAASVPSADKTMRAAWELGARLPEIDTLLETGVLDAPKARLVAEVFADLSDENAGQAEALLVPELTAPPAKTYAQVEHIATAIALTVDPHSGERRRKAAEKHAARVQMFRERAGTAGLSGRDLPTDQTLAAYANVNARANQYKDSAAFAKTRMDQLRAQAYLDLLNNVSAEDRIAHGLLTEQTPADAGAGDGADGAEAGTAPDDGAGGTRAPAPAGGPDPAQGPRPGGDDCPCPECDGSCLPDDDDPDDSDPDDDPGDAGPDDGHPGGGAPGNGGGSGPGGGHRDDDPGDDGDTPGDDGPRTGGGSGPGGGSGSDVVQPPHGPGNRRSEPDHDDTPGNDRPGNDRPGDGGPGDGGPGASGRPAAATGKGRSPEDGPGSRPGGDSQPPGGDNPGRPQRRPRPRLRPRARRGPARSCRTSSSRWPPCSARPTSPARDTASAPSTPTCAAPSPAPQHSAPTPPSASPSPTPTASPSDTAAPNPADIPPRPPAAPPRPTAGRLRPWSRSPAGSTSPPPPITWPNYCPRRQGRPTARLRQARGPRTAGRSLHAAPPAPARPRGRRATRTGAEPGS